MAMLSAKLTLCVVLSFALVSGVIAQTRCPIGTQMGSIQCIPDTPEMQEQEPPASKPTGEWVKTWGAIAGSDSTGEAGTSVGMVSKKEAEDTAIRRCAVNGASDCKLNLVYRNQCAAMVSTQSDSFYQGSATKERAIDLAMDNCKKNAPGECKVLYSDCSEPLFRKYR
ncbi:DUF4189 domain-containing protein [Xanthomonas axonopodis pv. poinsettiicola]|uniref:DUF4189 domain-containing protein n=1 Tax=Xanthomonas TaxID=338 RepID=UPI001E547C98|nr:DUF4189 domain-containing protein [Xanthomonas codiaei]MCC8537624.1 DUF4189 domain-containing protein [Xanthomonas codiaei]